MYKRILNLNEAAAGAQNQLSGELADSVANILAVKTYGREDYERGLFDDYNREVVARDSKRMMASLARGIVTAILAVAIMSVVTVFIAGGNAWFGITPGTLVMMFTYTYSVTNQFNFINNGLQRLNRAFGDASGMTVVLDEGSITNIAVRPDLRRLGLGRAVVTALLDRAREAGVVNVYLEVRVSNEPAIALYRSLGFATVGTRKNFYKLPTEDAYIMQWHASDSTNEK
jgi:ribosomal-protein-alanine acetyltransferase